MVGNAIFSETALRIFLIFCMKLGDYKGRKVTQPDFWKKFLIWTYLQKVLQISPKSDTLIFFSKTAVTILSVFGLKSLLNMTFNLNEIYFSEKIVILRYLASRSSKKLPKLSFFSHFLDFILSILLDFAHNDRWAWCLFIFLQFTGPVKAFLFVSVFTSADIIFHKLLELNSSLSAKKSFVRNCFSKIRQAWQSFFWYSLTHFDHFLLWNQSIFHLH